MARRLHPDVLDQLPEQVRRPAYDRASLSARMVHIGVGAFHRAHQSVFTDGAIEASGGGFGVTGISLQTPRAADQLNPQGGLFNVGVRDGETETLRIIGNMMRVLTAPDAPNRAIAAMSASATEIVSLTITEKGYCLDPASGNLDTALAGVAADLETPLKPRTAIGFLVEALRQRREAGHSPFTAISCDNLPSNGDRLSAAVFQFAHHIDPALARWIESEGAFPNTMVDRVVPATSPEDLLSVSRVLGMEDQGFVKTEPFSQWVIEDRFCSDRPDWGAAGALIVSDVELYETAKLRLLNGAHSAIAYLGQISGHAHVHDVMASAHLAPFIEHLMDVEILPTVNEPEGLSLPDYTTSLRARFSNTSLNHRTEQIAMDGSQKLPQRFLGTIRDCLKEGLPIDGLCVAVAAWMIYASGRGLNGEAFNVSDPMSEQTTQIGRAHHGDVDAMIAAYFKLETIFGNDLPRSETFSQTLRTKLNQLTTQGWQAAATGALPLA